MTTTLNSGKLTPETVLEVVCQDQQITRDELINGGRYRRFADPRACASKLLYVIFPDINERQIAEIIKMDRCTVYSHFRKVHRYPDVKAMFEGLLKKIDNTTF